MARRSIRSVRNGGTFDIVISDRVRDGGGNVSVLATGRASRLQFGPSFASELGDLSGKPFSWSSTELHLDDARLTAQEISDLAQVVLAHDPTAPAPPSPLDTVVANAIALRDYQGNIPTANSKGFAEQVIALLAPDQVV